MSNIALELVVEFPFWKTSEKNTAMIRDWAKKQYGGRTDVVVQLVVRDDAKKLYKETIDVTNKYIGDEKSKQEVEKKRKEEKEKSDKEWAAEEQMVDAYVKWRERKLQAEESGEEFTESCPIRVENGEIQVN